MVTDSFHSALLGDKDHGLQPGDLLSWKRHQIKDSPPHWRRPYQVLLTNPCTNKLKGVSSWFHISHLKKAFDYEWTSTPISDPSPSAAEIKDFSRTRNSWDLSRTRSRRPQRQTAIPRWHQQGLYDHKLTLLEPCFIPSDCYVIDWMYIKWFSYYYYPPYGSLVETISASPTSSLIRYEKFNLNTC